MEKEQEVELDGQYHIKTPDKIKSVKVTVHPQLCNKNSSQPRELQKDRVDAFLVYQPDEDGKISYKLAIKSRGAKVQVDSNRKQDNKLERPIKKSDVCDLSSKGVVGHLNETDKGIEYICDLDKGKCKRSFSSIAYLKSHQHTHYSQQLVCHICNRQFTWAHHLDYHMKVHNGIKQYQCTVPDCDKSFYTSQQRDVHMRTHSGVKPFQCENCQKGFTTLQNLTNHMRTHTGEKPFACDFLDCNKKFAELSSLKKHRVVHTGEKPHICSHCKKGFTQASTLRWHVRRYHTDFPPLKKSIANIQAQQKALAEARAKEQGQRKLKITNEIYQTSNITIVKRIIGSDVVHRDISIVKDEVKKEKPNNVQFQYVDMEILKAANLGRSSSPELTNPENSPFMAEGTNFRTNTIVFHQPQESCVTKSGNLNYNVEEVGQVQSSSCTGTFTVNSSYSTETDDEVMKETDYNKMYVEMTDEQDSDYNMYVEMSEETIL